ILHAVSMQLPVVFLTRSRRKLGTIRTPESDGIRCSTAIRREPNTMPAQHQKSLSHTLLARGTVPAQTSDATSPHTEHVPLRRRRFRYEQTTSAGTVALAVAAG